MTNCHRKYKEVSVESWPPNPDTGDMTMTQTPRSHRSLRRRVQQFVHHTSAAHSPSELAIRSIHEKRSTPRW